LQDVLLSQYNQTWKFPLPTVNFIAYYIIWWMIRANTMKKLHWPWIFLTGPKVGRHGW
jgi:hypothetical protein